MTDPYDVIVTGASVAGCATAILFAQRGARVALLEKRSDPQAYKQLCTHYIQPSSYPTLVALGLTEKLEAAGAVRNSARYWTEWGWIDGPDRDSSTHGYNIRRQTLDPLLREAAAGTPGVDLLTGHIVKGLLRDDQRVVGVTGTAGRAPFELRARLVVGADGNSSAIARLVGARTRTWDNNRFNYIAQWRGLERPPGDTSLSWFRDADVAYSMPNDGQTTVIACILPKEKLRDFQRNPEAAYRSYIASLPGAPDLAGAEQVTKLYGTVNYPLVRRQATGPGWALIGDAALTSDPLWGVGCGWAFQSGQWLADAAADAVQGAEPLEAALRRYRRARYQLLSHQWQIARFADGRALGRIERLIFSAAARDPDMAKHLHGFGARQIGLGRFISPLALGRAATVNAQHHLRQGRPRVAAAG